MKRFPLISGMRPSRFLEKNITFSLQSTSCAQGNTANCVAMLSKRLANVRKPSSGKPSSSGLRTSRAVAGPAPWTSAGPSSKEIPSSLDTFR